MTEISCSHCGAGRKKEQKLCHSCAGRNRDQAVRVKRAKRSESVGIPPLPLKKIKNKGRKDDKENIMCPVHIDVCACICDRNVRT